MVFFTKGDVKAGQELTFDYRFKEEEVDRVPCRCGAPNCKGEWFIWDPDASLMPPDGSDPILYFLSCRLPELALCIVKDSQRASYAR